MKDGKKKVHIANRSLKSKCVNGALFRIRIKLKKGSSLLFSVAAYQKMTTVRKKKKN
jgi:hypothetical protein